MTCVTNGQTNGPCPSTGYDASNHISTIGTGAGSYDAAGNLLGDGLYTYAWNAEGHVTSAAGVTYTYDGDGQRVKKSSGTLYWDGLAESDTSGNTWTNEYIFFAGQRIARRDGSGNVFYYFADALGSSRIIVQAGQTAPCYDAEFYLFGAETILTNTCSQNFKFAAMEYDTESADYHTWFRQYTPNQGRWLSPDPLGGDVANPQSLDRYAYALNSPTNLVDPLGLKDCAKRNTQTHQPPPCCIPSQVPEMALLYGPDWQLYLKFYALNLFVAQIEVRERIAAAGTEFEIKTVGTLGTFFFDTQPDILGTLGKYLFRGRRKGQSFLNCVGENASLTLTGSPKHAVGATLASYTSAAVGLLGTYLEYPPGLPLSQTATIAAGAAIQWYWAGGMVGGEAAPGIIFAAGNVAEAGAAVLGGAGIGVLIGSVAGCVSEGPFP